MSSFDYRREQATGEKRIVDSNSGKAMKGKFKSPMKTKKNSVDKSVAKSEPNKLTEQPKMKFGIFKSSSEDIEFKNKVWKEVLKSYIK